MKSLAFRIGWRLVAYPALAAAAFSFVLFWLYSHPRRWRGEITPKNQGLAYEAVTLTTADGVNLDAWFVPNPKSRRAVVVCHGYPMDKSDVLPMTAFLAKDFNLFYFDFRAMGRSGGTFTTGGAREIRDVDAALAWLGGKGFASAGLFGFSMGGATALLTANPAVKARALDAPFASLSGVLERVFSGFGPFRRPLLLLVKGWCRLLTGVNPSSVVPAAAAASIKTPLLIIHGDADRMVPLADSLAIKAAAPAAELWAVGGAGHGECRLKAGRAYEERVRAFFLKNL